MEITRNVILDLLPLYSANEVSADTRALVDEYLETDPELVNVAKQLETMEKPGDIPAALYREQELRAYKKARWARIVQILIIAGVMSVFWFAVLYAFLTPS